MPFHMSFGKKMEKTMQKFLQPGNFQKPEASKGVVPTVPLLDLPEPDHRQRGHLPKECPRKRLSHAEWSPRWKQQKESGQWLPQHHSLQILSMCQSRSLACVLLAEKWNKARGLPVLRDGCHSGTRPPWCTYHSFRPSFQVQPRSATGNWATNLELRRSLLSVLAAWLLCKHLLSSKWSSKSSGYLPSADSCQARQQTAQNHPKPWFFLQNS